MAGYRDGNSKEGPRFKLKSGIKRFDELDCVPSTANGNFEWFFHIRGRSTQCPIRFSLGTSLLEPEGSETLEWIRITTDDL
jgi:hypothetical protein